MELPIPPVARERHAPRFILLLVMNSLVLFLVASVKSSTSGFMLSPPPNTRATSRPHMFAFKGERNPETPSELFPGLRLRKRDTSPRIQTRAFSPAQPQFLPSPLFSTWSTQQQQHELTHLLGRHGQGRKEMGGQNSFLSQRRRETHGCAARRRQRSRRSYANSGVAGGEPAPISVEEAVKRVRDAHPLPAAGTVLKASGRARWLGMDSKWIQTNAPDGSVHVSIESPHVSVSWGFDMETDDVWEIDFNGLASALALDEKEVRLLMYWGQSGLWAHDAVNSRLKVEVVEAPEMPELWKFWHHPTPVHNEVPPPPPFAADPSTITFRIGIEGGTIEAFATYDRKTWQLKGLSVPSSGVLKHVRYENWFAASNQEDGVAEGGARGGIIRFPREMQDADEGGMTNVFTTLKAQLISNPAHVPSRSLFKCPHVPLLPADSTFDESIPSEVRAYRSRSNHILVQPTVNGVKYNVTMMLDTGASGLCISREFAEQLKMPGFGEVVIAGATQVITSQFRRAESLQIGPLKFNDPIFMELSLRGIVRAAPFPVVGILGYDVYRRMVLELPVVSSLASDKSHFNIKIYNPETYEEEVSLSPPPPPPSSGDRTEVRQKGRKKGAKAIQTSSSGAAAASSSVNTAQAASPSFAGLTVAATSSSAAGEKQEWTDVTMQGRTPLARTNVLFDDGTETPLQFMLDSGAGGMNIIFHERAKEQLRLAERGNVTRSSSITGISSDGGSTGSLGVGSMNIGSVALSHALFRNLSAYVPERGGLDISMHMAGILCNDLLIQCHAVYDYPRNRVLFVKEK